MGLRTPKRIVDPIVRVSKVKMAHFWSLTDRNTRAETLVIILFNLVLLINSCHNMSFGHKILPPQPDPHTPFHRTRTCAEKQACATAKIVGSFFSHTSALI